MISGTYYPTPSTYDDLNFPEPWDPGGGGDW